MRAALKLLAFVSASCLLAAADFRAGVGRIDITPETPIWLSGYAARTRPAETVLQKLWAKAVVLEAGRTRAVIVTTDLIGLPRPVSEEVAARALKQYGLPRALLLLNSSHTHSGPVLRANLSTMYNLTPEQDERVRRYTRKLVEDLVSVIGGALADLAPARVEFGRGAAAFAINRREPTPRGVKIGLNPAGPVDHEVPVLRISAPDGRLRAVLFGYACHNTTLSGYEVNGDYAGFAQSEFEDAHPGATGLFLMLCGGDQNPHPRGEVALARQHGKALAEVVAGVIRQPMATVQPPLRAAFTLTELVFAPHTRQTFEEELQSDNPYRRRRTGRPSS